MIAVQNELLAEQKSVPVARICRVLELPRSTAYYQSRLPERKPGLDEPLTAKIRALIERFPNFGIRRIWAYLRFRMGELVNRKKVARIMRLKGWTMRQRKTGLRPRVEISRSQAERPDQRWGTDIALVFCGAEDGWCSFVPVLDCCTREAMGWELSLTARAKTAERALESALIKGFGFVHGAAPGMKLRSDNGLVFGSKLYRRLCREYNLSQEFITPYTPEENGLVERFIRSFKEECVWLHNFESMAEARTEIAKWIDWYNNDRPHQALNYKTPDQARKEFNKLAA
jgi:putative transposase